MRMKRLLLTLAAAALSLISWQHLPGIGLGDPHQRGLSGGRPNGEDSLLG